jgi:hypothetical protein
MTIAHSRLGDEADWFARGLVNATMVAMRCPETQWGTPAVPLFRRLFMQSLFAISVRRAATHTKCRDGGSEVRPSPANRRRTDYFFLEAAFFFAAGFFAAGFFAAGFFFAVLRTALANVLLL